MRLNFFLSAIIYCLAINSVCFGQYPLGYLDGEYYSNDTIEKHVNLFDKPGGTPVGKATIKTVRRQGGYYMIRPEIDTLTWEVVKEEYRQYGYKGEFYFITYYEIKDDYINILQQTINAGLWLNKTAIDSFFKPTTFIEDITRYSLWQIYGYDQYRLRNTPSLKGDVLLTLDVEKHVIKGFTGKIKGSWAEVIIYEVDELIYDCYSEEEIKKHWTGKQWKGWIKVTDDHGQPNDIYYYYSC